MRDPFTPALESLHSLFQLESTRNGKYTFPEVQRLKESTDNYIKNPSKSNFIKLKKAVRGSMPYIEKWQLNFEPIKNSLDQVAELHGTLPINWPKLLSHSKASPKFQFSALNHVAQEENLLTWLAAKSGKSYVPLDHNELTQLLIEFKDENGFSKKLSHHLRSEPNFLFHLIMQSDANFSKIAQTLLILYLTDEQLAQAIIKHIPKSKQEEPTFEHVHSLVEKLNHVLSCGRSISTLLRNANAKTVLNSSIFFQIYQSDEYAHNEEYSLEPKEYLEKRIF